MKPYLIFPILILFLCVGISNLRADEVIACVRITGEDGKTGCGIVFKEDEEKFYILSVGHVVASQDHRYINYGTLILDFFDKNSEFQLRINGKVEISNKRTDGNGNLIKDLSITSFNKSVLKDTKLILIPLAPKETKIINGDLINSIGIPFGNHPSYWSGKVLTATNKKNLTNFIPAPFGGESGGCLLNQSNNIIGVISTRNCPQNDNGNSVYYNSDTGKRTGYGTAIPLKNIHSFVEESKIWNTE